jgi:hypothetical protein
MSAHAVLSPSAASRWLTCTPSARLEQKHEARQSEYADEGTLAHDVGKILILKKLGSMPTKVYEKQLKEHEKSKHYSLGMWDLMDEYSTFVLERYAEQQAVTKDALIIVEQQVKLDRYVPESFGTVDVQIVANRILDIIDLKYGKGVPVSAVNNKQLKLYALGCLDDFDFLYDIDTVRLTIYQPRLGSISTWSISVAELKQWGETELREKARLAYDGEGELVAGDHCMFCKIKQRCRANAELQMKLAEYEFHDHSLLTDEEIVDIFLKAKQFTSWLNGITKHAIEEAVLHNKQWPGLKLVQGRSNRRYVDETEIETLLKEKGFKEEDILKKKLIGIGDMTKLLGTTDFNKYLKDLVIKPDGKPTLVDENDNKPAYNPSEAAKRDFEEQFDDDEI